MMFSRNGNEYPVNDECCCTCGAPIAEYPDEGVGPEWDGFCSTDCQRLYEINVRRRAKGKPTLYYPNGLTHGLYRWLVDTFESTRPEIWSKRIYKGTACGAWLSAEGNVVSVGSIVEGADVDCETRWLEWPFSSDEFWKMVNDVEAEADEIWTEWHTDDEEENKL